MAGLPDQTDVTGVACVLCPEGSIAMCSGSSTLNATQLQEGATFCEAW